jgi:hypothetical protein
MRQEIARYIRNKYRHDGTVPSIRVILQAHSAVSRKRFYQFFPEGLREACQLSGVPAPTRRIQRMTRLRGVQTARSYMDTDPLPRPTRVILTAEQTRRICGLAHLEGGRDPVDIVTRLLDDDADARRHRLSFQQRHHVADFLETAIRVGWKVGENPDIVTCLTQLHNVGIDALQTDTVQQLVSLTASLQQHGWMPDAFVDHVTRHHNELQLYGQYRRGDISFTEFERRLQPYVQT